LKASEAAAGIAEEADLQGGQQLNGFIVVHRRGKAAIEEVGHVEEGHAAGAGRAGPGGRQCHRQCHQ
jgi:hypothetical protein